MLSTYFLKMKIKSYNEFIDKDVLYIFDFDDTLVNSPSYEELAIQFLKEDVTIKDLLNQSIDRIGVTLSDLKWQDGRIYVLDPNKQLKEFGNWVRKGDRLYMFSPNAFHLSDLSLPKTLKELSELYKSVENKCIVTAREESLRGKITNKLLDLGLELPKYGLHMAPVGTKNAGHWKGEKIVEIINETKFKKAIFYDDNTRYIKRATKVVREKLPNLDFKTVKVN
jgi:hypothetical protein